MNLRSLFIVCIAVLLSFTGTASAQLLPGSGLTLTSSTNNPIPGQTVTITATSYNFDINTATYTWTVAGKVVQKGIGKTTFAVQAPALGKKTAIEVTGTTQDGDDFSASLLLGSGSIDLIVESDGYVPPLFRGKTSLAYQNTVKVVAMPHLADASGKEYDPSTLIYQWSKGDGTTLAQQSGYGRQSISLQGGLVPRPYVLNVTVSTRDGQAQGQNSVDIEVAAPKIMFYIDDPLYGTLWNIAAGGNIYIGSQKEASVVASPYGFNIDNSGTTGYDMKWLVNGTLRPELSSSRSVVLRAPEGQSGSSVVKLSMRNLEAILQGAEAGFGASFKASTATNEPTATFQ